MDCQGCGTNLEEPDLQTINQVVDDVLQTSIDDARKTGGVCPLCGHSQFVPLWQRRWFQSTLLFVCWVTLGAIFLYRSPLKSSIAQESIRRAMQDARVKTALGEPIRVGYLSSGGIHRDETGWSEAKLSIPLSGPRGGATLRVSAGQGTGPWVYATLEVVIGEKTEPIDLLLGKVEVFSDNAYVAIHTEPAVQPDFKERNLPVPVWDGTFPVVRMTAQFQGNHWTYSHDLARDSPRLMYDTPVSSFEVSLDDGAFLLQQTDLFIADSIPLSLTRGYRVWDTRVSAFGLSTNHSFDVYPFGSRNPYTEMNLATAAGRRVYMDRISKGSGYADAWYEHVQTASSYYKARFWWNGDGWTFRLPDGGTWLFPESYSGKNAAQGAAFEIRNSAGQHVTLERDTERNLRRAVSPNGRMITFQYRPGTPEVSEAVDDQGHSVGYRYDSKNRLVQVRGADNRITQFTYDDSNLMTGVLDEAGHRLLQNFYYPNARIAAQVLGDGTAYRYKWDLDADGWVQRAHVQAPNGMFWECTFNRGVPIDQPHSAGSF